MGARVALGILTLTLCACTPRRIIFPQGLGRPLSSYHEVFNAAVDPCRRVRTTELMLAISGQAGDTKLRGRVRGAFKRPMSLRLEGLSPFGPPGFVLVTGVDSALLLLPRERHMIMDATGRDLLEFLAGGALDPEDFGAVLTGCLVPDPNPLRARTFGNGWVGVDLEGDATLFLHEVDGIPVVVAGRRNGLVVEYHNHARGLPRSVQVQTTSSSRVATNLTVSLSQVSINIDIDDRAFLMEPSNQFAPITIEELRDTVVPLKDSSQP